MASEDELDLFLKLGSEDDSSGQEGIGGADVDREYTSDIAANEKEKLEESLAPDIRREKVDPELRVRDSKKIEEENPEECGLLLSRKLREKTQSTPKAGYVCQFSKLRIEKPSLGSEAVKSRLSQLKWAPLTTLGYSATGKGAENRKSNNWATIGVFAEKSEIKSTAQGKPYICWTLYDLGTAVARLFLFDAAFSKHWREQVGSAWLVIDAKAFAKKDNQGGTSAVPAFSISRSEQAMKIGKAGDFGLCQATKRDGTKCEKPLNKNAGKFCEYHVSHQFSKLQSPRGGLGQTLVRNRVATKLCMERQSKVTNSLNRATKQQQASVASGRRSIHNEDWMSKASVSKRQRIGSLYVNVVKGQDSQMRNIRNAEEKLSKNKILIEMDNLNELEGREAARKLVLQKGIEFKAPDPNHIESPASFFEIQNRPGKPISSIDQLDVRRSRNKKGNRKPDPVRQATTNENECLSAFSKNFASVAAQGEAKELSHLRKAFEEEQFEDICNYLDSLSEKEKLLLKMEQVSELKKKGYFCQNCREFFLYKPKTCVDRDHSIESRAVVVRWFQCVPCKRVACVYSKFPKRACRGCGSDQFKRISMGMFQLNGRETMMPADEFRSIVRREYGQVEAEIDMDDRTL